MAIKKTKEKRVYELKGCSVLLIVVYVIIWFTMLIIFLWFESKSWQ